VWKAIKRVQLHPAEAGHTGGRPRRRRAPRRPASPCSSRSKPRRRDADVPPPHRRRGTIPPSELRSAQQGQMAPAGGGESAREGQRWTWTLEELLPQSASASRAHARLIAAAPALCCTLRSSMESAASPLVGSRMRSAPRAHEAQVQRMQRAAKRARQADLQPCSSRSCCSQQQTQAKQQNSSTACRTHATIMSAPDPSSAAAQPGADQVQRRRGEAQV
jgi:hypothetical protein